MKFSFLNFFTFLFISACLVLLPGCNTSSTSTNVSFPNSTSPIYFRSSQKVVVEIYYEPGAEPFTGTTAGGLNYWRILEDNLQAIFQYRSSPPLLDIPKTISAMTLLPAQNKTTWLGTEIAALSNQYRAKESTQTESRFYVYFLNGYYNAGSGASQSVIGVSLNGTPIIAVFKQVVQSTGANPNGPIPKYVEQSTLVHEMGHALGFVNNGVTLASAHQDTAHGAHTTNPNCVMYWQNEGASDLASFVQNFITNNTTVMWGAEVLQDARNFSQ